MKKKSKNVSKKIPKNTIPSMPYFLINSAGQIQEFGQGGIIEDPKLGDTATTTASDGVNVPGSVYGAAGNMASSAIGGESHLAMDRSNTKDKKILSGVASGAGSGAAMGSVIGPWGTAIGAVAGGIIGGVTSASAADKEIEQLKQANAGIPVNDPTANGSYYGAYGGELPTMYGFGGPTDPPSTNNTLIGNAGNAIPEGYAEKWKAQSGTDLPEGAYLTSSQLESYNKEGIASGYESNMVSPSNFNTGTSTPQKTNPGQMLSSTGAPLGGYNPLGNRQYSQYMEEAANDPTRLAQTKAVNDERSSNIELIKTMTPEQLADMRSKGQTPAQYLGVMAMGGDLQMMAMGGELPMGGEATEYNGNTHEEGGIAIGANKEVEDGEIRVGDYVFSDRLTAHTGKTFASEAKRITDKFKEYEGDGPAMKTQQKQLEELKSQNDIARAAKEKEDADMEAAMAEDYMAYGGMIKKDSKGKYQVDRSNRAELLGGAKKRGMSYSKYVEKVYAYGGGLDDKNDPRVRPNTAPTTMDLPVNGLATMGLSYVDQPTIDKGLAPSGLPAYDEATIPGTTLANKQGFGNEEAALLASSLPDMYNTISSLKGSDTNFERLKLDPISLEQERKSIKDAATGARNVNRANVRGTATSAGDALAALSAGNAGITRAEMDNLNAINANETNANIQLRNQMASTNVGIANAEIDARQQDEAMRQSVRSMAIANMANNSQGYLKDKKLSAENKAANERLLSLLDTGEYEIEMVGNEIKINYKDPKATK